jgi:hypothetical protein
MKKTPTPTTLAMCGFLLATASAHAADVAISIMYVTTPGVRSAWGGSSNTNSKITTQFGLLKTTHTNSQTEVKWTKTDNHEATYDSSDVTSITQRNRLISGGELEGTRATRNNRNADMVQMVCEWTDTGIAGVAQLPGWASVVNRTSFASTSGANSLTASHEVGHCLNAEHGHGFCISSPKERTIMEKNSDSPCSTSTRINWFSSKTIKKNGVTIGDNSNQNRERVRAQRATAGAYK